MRHKEHSCRRKKSLEKFLRILPFIITLDSGSSLFDKENVTKKYSLVRRPKIMDIMVFMVEIKANIEAFEIVIVFSFNGCLHTGGYLINLSICLTQHLCDGSTNQTLRLKADAKVLLSVSFGFCVLLFLSFLPAYLPVLI